MSSDEEEMTSNEEVIPSNEGVIPSLWSAVRQGELENVRKLIDDYGPFHLLTKSEEYDMLCIAVQMRHTEIAKLLLTKDFQVTSKNKIISGTLLCYAIRNGNIEILGLLLDKGVDINVTSEHSASPFDIAISNKKNEIIDLLLHREACFADISRNGITLLIIAVQSGNLQVVERLLNCGVSVDCQSSSIHKSRYTPLCFAVEKGNDEIVKLLLTRGANSNVKAKGNKTALHFAVLGGHTRIVELLLQHGAFVDAIDRDGKSSIIYAIINGVDLKIIQLLLTNKANVKDYPELLSDAVEKENLEVVEALLKHGADVNAVNRRGKTALYLTTLSKEGFKTDPNVKGKIAKLLLSRGADVNTKNREGITTLHAAIHKKYVKVVEALLEYNADVNIVRNDNGRTPLHISALKSSELISTMLLSKGANVNARDDTGATALHIAISYHNDRVAELLLRNGAKPNLRMRDEITPLHVAVRRNSIDIVELLIKFGAEINATDQFRTTPLALASIFKFTQICIDLLKCGADINILPKLNQKLLDGLFADNEMAMSFQRHLIKMKTANLHIIEEYLPLVSIIINKLSEFQHECEKEIENIKREKINNDVSFYNILTEDISRLDRFARNENISQVLASSNYSTKFPLYATMIESNIRKGKRRKELLEQLFHFQPFPCHCSDKIFIYLSNADLNLLVEACKINNE